MSSRPVLVVLTLVAALAGLVVVGLRIFERDRHALYERYAADRSQGLEDAALGLASDVADIGEDLKLASTLLLTAESTRMAERELHAIATIKREYLVLYARDTAGATTKVVALGTHEADVAPADSAVDELFAKAQRAPGELQVSPAFDGPRGLRYRLFARHPTSPKPAVVVVVDMRVLLSRMKLPREPGARIAMIDAVGASLPSSDPELARLVPQHPRLREVVRAVRRGEVSRIVLDADESRAAGAGENRAVAIGIPLAFDLREPWVLLAVVSTSALQAQETTVVRRVLAGSALVLVLLLSATAYVVRNAYRARTLRERLRHADRLAHLTEKAEKILDHIPSGVLALAEDGRITGVNRQLADRLGRDIVGATLETAFASADPGDLELVHGLVARATATGEPQTLHRDPIALLGGAAALNIHAVPLARGGGDVSLLLVFDDLTDLRRIEQRLLHSEKLVTAGQLAAGIAHEVGTPLSVARGRVELALSHLGKEHAEAENHRVVIDQIDRVTRLLQQLLDYVRPAPMSIQQVDLAQALHVVRGLLDAQATKRGVTLHVDAAPGAGVLRGDPDQLQQIMINLALNAIDACGKGGRVDLKCHTRPDGAVVLEIQDDGQGIPRELHKQVFDPFFTTKKRGQGTGLGLWVVAQLVRAQSAEIELTSTPGTGTLVRVTWPEVA